MPQVKCPMCHTVVQYADGFSPVCSSCGYAGTLATPMAPAPAAPTAGTGAPSLAIGVVGLVLNLAVWPGLGTLVAGRIGEGLTQGLLFLLGILLFFTIIFIPVAIALCIAMWVWALVSGIRLVQEASAATPKPAVST